ncbi:Nucleic-acid-binding protein from transposon X-element [Formica fusca]
MARQNKAYSIDTKNRFNLLTDSEDTDMDWDDTNDEQDYHAINNSSGKSRTSKNPIGKRKPPPIIIHGKVKSHGDLIDKVKGIISNKFFIKYQTNRTAVHTETQEDYKKLIAILESDGAQYHTFIPKDRKAKAFVIRGLPKNIDNQDIKNELKEFDIQVNNCNEMTGTHNPLYMVTILGSINIRILVHKVKYLNHTKITWERYLNKKRVTQCHRCQEWGHATSNCHVTPKCLKCAENHLTRECKKPATIPARCANCGKDHPANAIICEKYIEKLNWISKMTRTNKHQPKGNITVDITGFPDSEVTCHSRR